MGCLLRTALAEALLGAVLLNGCSTTSQNEYPVQLNIAQRPAADAEENAKSPQISNQPEQVANPEIDEKSSVFFPLGSSSISLSEKDKLKFAAKQLKEDKGLCVTLHGYANDNGSSSFNLAVADARIQSVSTSLKKLGVQPYQIKKNVIGGEKNPSNCSSQDCRRKMRRVDLIFSQPR